MRVIHKAQNNAMILELSTSDDKLKLFARVTPQDGYATASEEDLKREILAVTPEELIDQRVLSDIIEELRRGNGCEARRVAKGTAPVSGRDGKLVWLVRRFSPGKAEDMEREFVDFFTLGLFENIAVGCEVARVYKPSTGITGKDVLGKPLSARAGKNLSLRFDKTIELRQVDTEEAYSTLVATIDGYVHEEGDKFGIKDTLNIPGNLDYSMGHLDFIGSVKIQGDIQKGFNIKARGTIEVLGSVFGDNILTSDSSITIKGFHYGGKASFLSAKGDYTADIAEKVSTEVGGNITIGREARDCSLHTSSAVFASHAKIIGGSVWCVNGFEGAAVGNGSGVKTEIELRNELEVTKEYRKLSENVQKHEAAAAALELHIGPYLKNRSRVPLLNNQFKIKITALLDKYDQVQKSLQVLHNSEKKLRDAKPIESSASVNVLETMYSGAVLKTGSSAFEIKDTLAGPLSFKPTEDRSSWSTEQFKALIKG